MESPERMSEVRLPFQTITFTATETGARLIVLGAVHGNETCGTEAIRRVVDEIERGALALVAGSVTFVPVANPLAYARGARMGDRNLNRMLVPTAAPKDFEDHVANWLCPLLARHDALLDLHSFHTPGEPFVMLGPENNDGTLEPFARAGEETAFALALGVRRVIDGWLDTYAAGVARRRVDAASANADVRYGVGTTEYMRAQGGIALTLECGQHEDPAAPEVAYRAIHRALAQLGISNAATPAAVSGAEALRLYRVVDRAHAADRFVREWASFDPVRAGEVVGVRHDGSPVVADCDGYVVFPHPGAEPGHEWFYLARPSNRV